MTRARRGTLVIGAVALATACGCSSDPADAVDLARLRDAASGESATDAGASRDAARAPAAGSDAMVMTGERDAAQASDADAASSCRELEQRFDVVPAPPKLPAVTIIANDGAETNLPFPGAERRRAAIHAALLDPIDGVIAGLDYEVSFAAGSSHAAEAQDGVCLTSRFGPGTPTPNALSSLIFGVGAAALPGDPADPHTPQTNTATQLWSLFNPEWNQPPPGPTVILLLAGESRACPDAESALLGSRGPPVEDRALALTEIARGLANGTTTHVIDVTAGADPELSAHYDALAAAGGSDQAHHPADLSELYAVLYALIGAIVPCRFTLDEPLDPAVRYAAELEIDGMPLPFAQDGADGFRITGDGRLELTGGVCRWLRRGHGGEVQVRFRCP